MTESVAFYNGPPVVLVPDPEWVSKPLRPYAAALQGLRKLSPRFQVRHVRETLPATEPLGAVLQVVLAHDGEVFAPQGLRRPAAQPLLFVLPGGKNPFGEALLEAYLLPRSPQAFADELGYALVGWDGESKLRLKSKAFLRFQANGRPEKAVPPPRKKKPTLVDRVLRRESFLPEAESDQPAREDHLGFAPYVEALAGFLAAPGTRPPLTVSVEGEWGAGKSSFMLQLQEELQRQPGLKDGAGRVFTVWFNPWRYDRGESMWAAFALHFIASLESQLTWWERFQARLALGWNRSGRGGPVSRKRAGGALAWLAAACALGIALPVSALLALPASTLASLLAAGGAAAGLLSAAYPAMAYATSAVGRVRSRLEKEIRSPDYAGRAAFIEQFHEDFRHIVEAYVEAPRLFVFVDDLDRCDVPRAAELMQAINLLIADDPRIVFLLGMDREKVAAGIAVKHRELLPFMDGLDGQATRSAGLLYGYTFIEKFIQIPFGLPTPTEAEIGNLLRRGKPAPAPKAAGPSGQAEAPATGQGEAGPGQPGGGPAAKPPKAAALRARERRRSLEVGFEGDSDAVLALAVQLAPVFGSNPRRVKQFVNLFRLRGFIASRTGLFDAEGEAGEALTLEQLGKFVALSIRFPLLLDDLQREPGLLADLQEQALGEKVVEGSPAFKRWAAEPDLLRLLAVGNGGKVSPGHDMRGVDVARLLRVSPAVPSEPAPQAGAQPPPVAMRSDTPAEPDGQSRETYRLRVEEAWASGPPSRVQARVLEAVRTALGLSREEADAIEAAVARSHAPPVRGPRRK